MRALTLTTLLVVIGSVMSATLPHGAQLFKLLAACRLVTGLGVGGIYPLTAASSIEERVKTAYLSPIGRTLMVFSGQGWGQLLAPLVVYALVQTNDEETTWRSALGIGALPAVFAVALVAWRAWRDANSPPEPEDVIVALAGDHPDNAEAARARSAAAAGPRFQPASPGAGGSPRRGPGSARPPLPRRTAARSARAASCRRSARRCAAAATPRSCWARAGPGSCSTWPSTPTPCLRRWSWSACSG